MARKIRFEWEGKNFEVEVERVGDRLTLTHEGKSYVVTLLPERTQTGAAPLQAPIASPSKPGSSPAGEIDSAGALHAPMTGVIKEIKVAPGHNVEQGQVILIMEAMKMDIDLPSPASGIVAEVLVTPGQTVSAEQKLVVIH